MNNDTTFLNRCYIKIEKNLDYDEGHQKKLRNE